MDISVLLELDTRLFLIFNRDFANPFFDIVFPILTNKHFWIFPGLAAAALFYYKKRKEALIVLGLALITVAITDLLCYRVLKPLFGRLRPCHPDSLVEGGRFLLGFKKSLAFPSNHAMNVFGQAEVFSAVYPKYSVYFFIFAGLVAFSRVYVGVHYPLDVLAGAVGGIICGWAVTIVARQVEKMYIERSGR